MASISPNDKSVGGRFFRNNKSRIDPVGVSNKMSLMPEMSWSNFGRKALIVTFSVAAIAFFSWILFWFLVGLIGSNGCFGYCQNWSGWVRCVHMESVCHEKTPLEFLDSLKRLDHTDAPECVAMDKIGVEHWISKDNVKELARRLDSKIPCLKVVENISSEVVTEPSTEGKEAQNIILGYMKGHYPPNPGEATKPETIKKYLDEEKIAYPL